MRNDALARQLFRRVAVELYQRRTVRTCCILPQKLRVQRQQRTDGVGTGNSGPDAAAEGRDVANLPRGCVAQSLRQKGIGSLP